MVVFQGGFRWSARTAQHRCHHPFSRRYYGQSRGSSDRLASGMVGIGLQSRKKAGECALPQDVLPGRTTENSEYWRIGRPCRNAAESGYRRCEAENLLRPTGANPSSLADARWEACAKSRP